MNKKGTLMNKMNIMIKVIMNKNEHNEQSNNEQEWKMNKIWMNKNVQNQLKLSKSVQE